MTIATMEARLLEAGRRGTTRTVDVDKEGGALAVQRVLEVTPSAPGGAASDVRIAELAASGAYASVPGPSTNPNRPDPLELPEA